MAEPTSSPTASVIQVSQPNGLKFTLILIFGIGFFCGICGNNPSNDFIFFFDFFSSLCLVLLMFYFCLWVRRRITRFNDDAVVAAVGNKPIVEQKTAVSKIIPTTIEKKPPPPSTPDPIELTNNSTKVSRFLFFTISLPSISSSCLCHLEALNMSNTPNLQ